MPEDLTRESYWKSDRHVRVINPSAHIERACGGGGKIFITTDGWRVGPDITVNVCSGHVNGLPAPRHGEPALICEGSANCGSEAILPVPFVGSGAVQQKFIVQAE